MDYFNSKKREKVLEKEKPHFKEEEVFDMKFKPGGKVQTAKKKKERPKDKLLDSGEAISRQTRLTYKKHQPY